MSVSVLLVDDSAVIRGLMARALEADSGIKVAGSAANGLMAISMAKQIQPNVIILDIEMPVMDGIAALPELIKISPGSKIIMASTLTMRNAEISLKALSLGATDYLAKPSAKTGADAEQFYKELIEKIKVLGISSPHYTGKQALSSPMLPVSAAPAASPTLLKPEISLQQAGIQALAIASSTGGPQALMKLFAQLKGSLSGLPIFITQHMPATFTTILAEHISRAGERDCTEAKNGEDVRPGHVYLAPGDYHMVAERAGDKVILKTNQNPPENFCRPAADPMLRSLSDVYGSHLLVLVLTGMGQDGLEGAKVVVKNGGHVIAQNEASCVVYGMPKAVVDNNLCRAVLPLDEIAPYLAKQLGGR